MADKKGSQLQPLLLRVRKHEAPLVYINSNQNIPLIFCADGSSPIPRTPIVKVLESGGKVVCNTLFLLAVICKNLPPANKKSSRGEAKTKTTLTSRNTRVQPKNIKSNKSASKKFAFTLPMAAKLGHFTQPSASKQTVCLTKLVRPRAPVNISCQPRR